MNQEIRFTHLHVVVVVILGVIFALFCGSAAGGGDYTLLAELLALPAFLIYISYFVRQTIYIILFLSFIDMQMAPIGFVMSASEQVLLVSSVVFCVYWWKKGATENQYSNLFSYQVFTAVTTTYILYAIAHCIFNMLDPYSLVDYGLKNALKTYETTLGGFFLLLYFLKRQRFFAVVKSPHSTVSYLLLIALVFNIACKFYYYTKNGFGAMSEEETVDRSVANTALVIPILNAAEGFFALRVLSPLAALIGAVLLTSPRRYPNKILFLSIIILAFIGAILSGGRVSLLVAACLCVLVAFIRKRHAPIILFSVSFILIAVTANLLDESQMHSLPPMVQRSVSFLAVNKKKDLAAESISESSSFRKTLFYYALDQWRKDSRIFWFGRSAGIYDESDYRSYQTSDVYDIAVTAIRRIATHNLITDLLIMYGLVGCVLYYASCFALLAFLISWYRSAQNRPASRDWILISILFLSYYIIYASIGGNMLWANIPCLIILASLVDRRELLLLDQSKITAVQKDGTTIPDLRTGILEDRR